MIDRPTMAGQRDWFGKRVADIPEADGTVGAAGS